MKKPSRTHTSFIRSPYIRYMIDSFLLEEVPLALKRLEPSTQPEWGSMDAVEMLDHLYTGLILGQDPKEWPIRTEEEKLPAVKAFLMGPKPLPRNAEKPISFIEKEQPSSEDLQAALNRFLNEIPHFLKGLDRSDYRMVHPDFGVLNAEEALVLARKHTRHHLAQFGLMER